MDKYRNNQSISEKANQLIGHYQVKANSGKEEVLDTILNKIEAENKLKEKPVRKINWFAATAISAAATVALLVAFYFFTATQTISAPQGETFSYRLPDESRVVLRDGSTIEFGKYYRQRQVALTGKAYFEVVKGEGFAVETTNGDIEVLGTRFLVADFDKQLKVQCFQGKVKTSYNNNSWILEPGTQFSGGINFAAKEKLEEKTGYPEFAAFFRSFSNAPLTEVVSELESFFNIRIDLQAGHEKNFTGTFETGNPESAIRILCGSLQLNYEFTDKYRIIIF